MKTIFALLAVATLAIALNGCGKKEEPAKPTDVKGSVSTTAVPTAPAPQPTN